jgi:hypothetical protein
LKERSILIPSFFDFLFDGGTVTGVQCYNRPDSHTNVACIAKTVLREKVQELYGLMMLPVLSTPRVACLKPAVQSLAECFDKYAKHLQDTAITVVTVQAELHPV